MMTKQAQVGFAYSIGQSCEIISAEFGNQWSIGKAEQVDNKWYIRPQPELNCSALSYLSATSGINDIFFVASSDREKSFMDARGETATWLAVHE
jgi:hypothetical protein